MRLRFLEPGKTGPNLRPHPSEYACPSTAAQGGNRTLPSGFPEVCGGLFNLSRGGNLRIGARNVPIALIAGNLYGIAKLPHPVVDQTGLSGNFDFVLEWTPDPNPEGFDNGSATGTVQTVPFRRDDEAPTAPPFQKALKAQLGLKLESQKRQVDVMIFDRLERPSAN